MYSLAILIPLTSRSREWKNIKDTYLNTIFMKSFKSTTDNSCRYTFYFGIDEEEKIYTEESLISLIKSYSEDYFVNITRYDDTVEGGHVTKMWNIIFEKAYNDNLHDYYYQCGDDIYFTNKEWVNKSIKMLQSNNNIGLSGPSVRHRKNSLLNIMTQVMFSNKHYEIFKSIFPEEIRNWYCDNWINDVYEGRIFRLKRYSCYNKGGSPRYKVMNKPKFYDELVAEGKQLVEKFLNKSNNKTILIICGGKSSGDIDWDFIKKHRENFSIFCMNSMYKMFEKLDFYPDYYASLDAVCLADHREAIQKFTTNNKIKKFFFVRTKKAHMNKDSRSYIVNEVSPTFDGVSDSINNFHSWGNTGSNAVQLSIMMGYKNIYIIGVDGYVEVINEAKEVNGILKINETPKDNPNYWFSDYHSKNETYNFPNANVWHVPGWNYAAKMCNKYGVKIYNMSHNKDYIKTIPFIPYSEFENKYK